MRDRDAALCPFCRTPTPTSDEEAMKREKKRSEAGDSTAIEIVGTYHDLGINGYPQDHNKALELWHRAGELGNTLAYYNIGCAYDNGRRSVEVDKKKARHYWELAAMGGDATARYNLGNNEWRLGNMDRAIKHYMISVRGGAKNSLDNIQDLYKNGHATKDDYLTALRSYQVYLNEIKSAQRDEAAAYNDDYKYMD